MRWKDLSAALKESYRADMTISEAIDKYTTGIRIGEGCYRCVYPLKLDDRYVLKVEADLLCGVFANITEYRNYVNNEYCDFQKWLAPSVMISTCGRFLFQRRARPPKPHEFPSMLPAPLTDIKSANFGMIGKRFVALDYSYLLMENPNKMKKIKWDR